jgi:type II secretory pathway component PulK
MRTARRRARPNERGVVLLLVLWVFMTLGVLALDFSSEMRDDASATMNLADQTRAYYAAVAGMNRALYENTLYRKKNPSGTPPQPIDPSKDEEDVDGDGQPDTPLFKVDGDWHPGPNDPEGWFEGMHYAVRLTGEDGRIPLNVDLAEDMTLFTDILRHVVTNLVRGGNQTTGVDKQTETDIETVVDSILDWRDCDDEERLNGAESKYYGGLPRPYAAKNGFFDSPEELMRIKGVTPEIFFGHDGMPGLGEIFTPYPRGEAIVINPMQVTPAVVRALVSDPEGFDVEGFIQKRRDDPVGAVVDLQGEIDRAIPGLGERVKIVEPKYVRVEARADVQQSRNLADVMAVVELAGNDADEPIIHSWLDRAPVRADGPDAPADSPGAGHS